MRLIVATGTILLCTFLSSGVFAECTVKDKREMKNAGMSDAKIQRICSVPDDDAEEEEVKPKTAIKPKPQSGSSRNQSPTNICQTQFMWCAIGQFGAPGLPCWCNSPYGPLNGVLIQR